MKQIAIIGPTASGKTALSISVAEQIDAHILSLDSLSIYKEIDIASAKPTVDERAGIRHYGIDELYPDEPFDVTIYIELYKRAYSQAKKENKNLIIVGGTGFYLKSLIDGISELPTISLETKTKRAKLLQNLAESYELLYRADPEYMQQISPHDSYRIEKALDIYLETTLTPTTYFAANPPKPTIEGHISIYQIEIARTKLRERIALRTEQMIDQGLIDEVAYLERRYTRSPNCMRSIGIRETLDFLDGIYSREMLAEKITTNTARLAKRQVTFNSSQFASRVQSTDDLSQYLQELSKSEPNIYSL